MAGGMRAEIDVIIHATEDESLVYEALEEQLGIIQEMITIQNLTGHYDNPITMVNCRLDKKNAEAFVDRLSRGMAPGEFTRLASAPQSSGVHIRLDKQRLVRGRLEDVEGGSVRIRIHIPVYDGNMAGAYAQLLRQPS
ncbi:exosome subunit [Cenarchaeum symbiosum A]|uniref:Exosome subunit n=1 Tax=Cenarchaeum symbiosum (strain A) TaxID=414004 RepID=A0RTS6_CENSY|nr:exosome subunit [Cenarchaeum symbiosum A]